MARLPSVPFMVICSVVSLLLLSGIWFMLWPERTSDSKSNEIPSPSVDVSLKPAKVTAQTFAGASGAESDKSSSNEIPSPSVDVSLKPAKVTAQTFAGASGAGSDKSSYIS
eukprot:243318_1